MVLATRYSLIRRPPHSVSAGVGRFHAGVPLVLLHEKDTIWTAVSLFVEREWEICAPFGGRTREAEPLFLHRAIMLPPGACQLTSVTGSVGPVKDEFVSTSSPALLFHGRVKRVELLMQSLDRATLTSGARDPLYDPPCGNCEDYAKPHQ